MAHELDAIKKGLSLTVDLGELPFLDPNKSAEDHLCSDNAKVIDITNSKVVPKTQEMKISTAEKKNSFSDGEIIKMKHSYKRRHYYRKKDDKEKEKDSEAFKHQLVTWLKENRLKLSPINIIPNATTSTEDYMIHCKMKFLTWNIRGLSSSSKRAIIKSTIFPICPIL
uniref:Uncharacterized protein n=1 Tax=Cucumis melo TaxID=3656 RepID=A0A9I9EHB3_CUCME